MNDSNMDGTDLQYNNKTIEWRLYGFENSAVVV
jgi:hypothetical protein